MLASHFGISLHHAADDSLLRYYYYYFRSQRARGNLARPAAAIGSARIARQRGLVAGIN